MAPLANRSQRLVEKTIAVPFDVERQIQLSQKIRLDFPRVINLYPRHRGIVRYSLSQFVLMGAKGHLFPRSHSSQDCPKLFLKKAT
jgi:hypothetical protein